MVVSAKFLYLSLGIASSHVTAARAADLPPQFLHTVPHGCLRFVTVQSRDRTAHFQCIQVLLCSTLFFLFDAQEV